MSIDTFMYDIGKKVRWKDGKKTQWMDPNKCEGQQYWKFVDETDRNCGKNAIWIK